MLDFFTFALVGFFAQAVDGALGMAYGVISSTVLLGVGLPPAQVSASVHAAELFTTAASGSGHLYHRNIDWKLFARLAPFGIIGGVTGAYVLTSIDGSAIKPFITTYLAALGIWIFARSFRKLPNKPVSGKLVAPLGLAGGFLDASGGGGWGPIVTTGLLGAGGAPRYVIGTVNASEFLITLSVSLAFLIALLTGHWEDAGDLSSHATSIAGLIVGGLVAAPLAGWMVRHVPEKILLRAVGTVICTLAITQTIQQVFAG
ncbi:sulfite exporter TauE/SafE family protein [Rhizobium sp. EC-SD404]|uniref:sulfite exporter TauE/SafE family protein n=1 Tax=Rhizobium sp. EC-SD404 TaxID=2038389 RepID=UPI0012584240|nr:sulfite exporter TauE/SafE family protein [Rhizobium sp. EC-SD404]VVT06934.1 putative membrane transporter protein YtnM [Rhizobium sp. EC-SD404]